MGEGKWPHAIKVLKSRDVVMFVTVAVILLAVNFLQVGPLKSLPSPIFGGDYYYQLGTVNNFKYGGDPLRNSNLPTANPGYLPLFAIIAGLLAKVLATLGVGTFGSMYFLTYLLAVFEAASAYALFSRLTANAVFAGAGALLFASFAPIFKYTEFTSGIVVPLYVFLLLSFWRKRTNVGALLLGVAGGLASISHATAFVFGFFIAGLFFLAAFFEEGGEHGLRISALSLATRSALFLAAAVPIALLFWYNPLFVHHGRTSPHYLEWNGAGDLSTTTLRLSLLKDLVFEKILNFETAWGALKALLTVAGALLLFRTNEKGGKAFLKILTLGFLALTLSYLVTAPLLGINFLPASMIEVVGRTVFAILMVLAVDFVFARLRTHVPEKKWSVAATGALFAAIVGAKGLAVADYLKHDRFYPEGLSPLKANQAELADFIVKNTDVDDIVLTTKELGFMVNALTGRKLVVARRAQNDAYEDMDRRELDAAVLFYGRDGETKKALLRKYNVKYLYWDEYWWSSEYRFNEAGVIVGVFDPLVAFADADNRRYLELNGVAHVVEKSYLDPTLQGDKYPRYDLIRVTPRNYRSFYRPWDDGLERYITPVWKYANEKGDVTAALFRVNAD